MARKYHSALKDRMSLRLPAHARRAMTIGCVAMDYHLFVGTDDACVDHLTKQILDEWTQQCLELRSKITRDEVSASASASESSMTSVPVMRLLDVVDTNRHESVALALASRYWITRWDQDRYISLESLVRWNRSNAGVMERMSQNGSYQAAFVHTVAAMTRFWNTTRNLALRKAHSAFLQLEFQPIPNLVALADASEEEEDGESEAPISSHSLVSPSSRVPWKIALATTKERKVLRWSSSDNTTMLIPLCGANSLLAPGQVLVGDKKKENMSSYYVRKFHTVLRRDDEWDKAVKYFNTAAMELYLSNRATQIGNLMSVKRFCTELNEMASTDQVSAQRYCKEWFGALEHLASVPSQHPGHATNQEVNQARWPRERDSLMHLLLPGESLPRFGHGDGDGDDDDAKAQGVAGTSDAALLAIEIKKLRVLVHSFLAWYKRHKQLVRALFAAKVELGVESLLHTGKQYGYKDKRSEIFSFVIDCDVLLLTPTAVTPSVLEVQLSAALAADMSQQRSPRPMASLVMSKPKTAKAKAKSTSFGAVGSRRSPSTAAGRFDALAAPSDGSVFDDDEEEEEEVVKDAEKQEVQQTAALSSDVTCDAESKEEEAEEGGSSTNYADFRSSRRTRNTAVRDIFTNLCVKFAQWGQAEGDKELKELNLNLRDLIYDFWCSHDHQWTGYLLTRLQHHERKATATATAVAPTPQVRSQNERNHSSRSDHSRSHRIGGPSTTSSSSSSLTKSSTGKDGGNEWYFARVGDTYKALNFLRYTVLIAADPYADVHHNGRYVELFGCLELDARRPILDSHDEKLLVPLGSLKKGTVIPSVPFARKARQQLELDSRSRLFVDLNPCTRQFMLERQEMHSLADFSRFLRTSNAPLRLHTKSCKLLEQSHIDAPTPQFTYPLTFIRDPYAHADDIYDFHYSFDDYDY